MDKSAFFSSDNSAGNSTANSTAKANPGENTQEFGLWVYYLCGGHCCVLGNHCLEIYILNQKKHPIGGAFLYM